MVAVPATFYPQPAYAVRQGQGLLKVNNTACVDTSVLAKHTVLDSRLQNLVDRKGVRIDTQTVKRCAWQLNFVAERPLLDDRASAVLSDL